jgi:CRP-like cAMP-binding protein
LEDLRAFFNRLHPLTPSTWEQVAALFVKGHLSKGELFTREGQFAKQLGFLQKGVIRAFYRTEQGVEYNKHFFIAPCMIGGYASMITGKPNQIIQEALTECEILTADFAAIQALYDFCPDLERAARRIAELFFVEKEQREIDIVLLTADKRYQLFLEQHPGLEQIIPQYHIASYLGITPTQLSRIRRKMAER